VKGSTVLIALVWAGMILYLIDRQRLPKAPGDA
jgi:hypothetical protein